MSETVSEFRPYSMESLTLCHSLSDSRSVSPESVLYYLLSGFITYGLPQPDVGGLWVELSVRSDAQSLLLKQVNNFVSVLGRKIESQFNKFHSFILNFKQY